jgi:hypothetical protein
VGIPSGDSGEGVGGRREGLGLRGGGYVDRGGLALHELQEFHTRVFGEVLEEPYEQLILRHAKVGGIFVENFREIYLFFGSINTYKFLTKLHSGVHEVLLDRVVVDNADVGIRNGQI